MKAPERMSKTEIEKRKKTQERKRKKLIDDQRFDYFER